MNQAPAPFPPRSGSHPRGPHLTGRFADGTLGEFPLGPTTSLGRHPSNTLRLVDREVSKEHATIEKVGRDFVLRDLNSSNGTFVNGRRVTGEMRLKDGDEIALGSSRLVFHSGEAAPGGANPPTLPGVTVVANAVSMPAFLAQMDQVPQNFRPADQVTDTAALRRDYEKLRIVHEFHRQVSLKGTQDDLFEQILKVAFELLAADHGVILKVGPQGEFIPAAVHHRQGKQVNVMLSDTVLKRVVETGKAVLTADAIIDERFSAAESIVAQGIRSAMAVPLLVNGDIMAVLFLDSRQQINAFSEKDLTILSGIAAQAGIALENAALAEQIRNEAVTRAELSRFLSKAVADAVINGGTEDLRQSRLAEVSCLFADIRGFTTLAESDSPQEVVSMLNSFFTAMADVVFRYEGNLDKFIGDCVMAVWGPPSSHPDDPARALRAALEMQDAVTELNRQRVLDGKKPIEVGIGVNTGQAVVGYMGSAERHEFTAIGDTVNTASRLCGIAKSGEVLASEATVRKSGPGFDVEELPVLQVKGKEKGVQTFRVHGAELTTSTSRKVR
ncbi:FHA domain-containing protein [Corallococcus sp. CA054B]|uniref:Putative adenylate cyclase n=1 Tax=Corallococcus coralloides TaxID=184914 RepID=A0A410RU15_CORCK|nr:MULTISPECIES: adenylate/guanylate cyclase domain-containing protein [Corallococcus]QAT85409.1 putative adenylate cyclase [Corallococcus coralloides]RKG59209.1 FHA domain-containing protein [Corallococcus sp. CA054B]RKH81668.1 FHA domain-containing protein [Corallococcus sp. AB045]